MACPLTLSYLKTVSKLRREVGTAVLFDEELDVIDDLIDQADADTPVDSTLRLRAFYCIEVWYSIIIPKVIGDAFDHLTETTPDSLNRLMFNQFPRSWSGMGDLLECLQDVNSEAVMESTEVVLIYGSKTTTGQVVSASALKVAGDAIDQCKKAIELLRRDLRDPITDIHRIGGMLGSTACFGVIPITEFITHGKALLTINLDNAYSPWKEKNVFPV